MCFTFVTPTFILVLSFFLGFLRGVFWYYQTNQSGTSWARPELWTISHQIGLLGHNDVCCFSLFGHGLVGWIKNSQLNKTFSKKEKGAILSASLQIQLGFRNSSSNLINQLKDVTHHGYNQAKKCLEAATVLSGSGSACDYHFFIKRSTETCMQDYHLRTQVNGVHEQRKNPGGR